MWTPAQLRGRRLYWLLDLTWEDQVYRISTEPVDAPTGEAGATWHYSGGLVLPDDYEDRLDLFDVDSGSRSVSLTLHLAGLVDVPKRIAEGWDLASATGRLMLWPEGGGAGEIRVIIDGPLREPEYGAEEEPVTAGLEEEDADDTGGVPAEGARYTADTWPGGTGDTEKYGERYPVVFGRPGGGAQEGSAVLHVSSGRFLIAAHWTAASQVRIYDEADGTSEVFGTGQLTDSEGNPCTTVDVSGAAVITVAVGDPFWVGWMNGGGALGHDGLEARGAGSVLRWWSERSTLRWDRGRVAAAIPWLDSFLIDAVAAASPDERLRPLDWIRDHLLPILPISLRRGPEGLYPVVWRWDATEQDAVAVLDADAGRVARPGPVQYGERDGIRNELVLRYKRNARTDRFTARRVLTGDRQLPDLDADARVSGLCAASLLRYGRRPLEETSDVVAEDATADRILSWWARRYALPSRRVSYDVGHELGHLEPGDPVLVRDAEVGLPGRVALVEEVRWSTRGTMQVAVRTVPAPERDRLP